MASGGERESACPAKENKGIDFYLDNCFPNWKTNSSQTYIFPSRYIPSNKTAECIAWPQLPKPLSSNSDCSKLSIRSKGGLGGNAAGNDAEYDVLKAFCYYCLHTNQPAFIFSNIRWFDEKKPTGEIDIILVHKDMGIILVETKSDWQTKKSATASDQLSGARKKLIDLSHQKCSGAVTLDDSSFKNVKAFPNNHVEYITELGCFQLGNNHLKSYECFNNWWRQMKGDSDSDGKNVSIYHQIIPQLFIMLQESPDWESDDDNSYIAETVEWLKNQEFQNQYMKSIEINDSENVLLQKEWKYITLEQCKAWVGKKHQVFCGPPGSGKTVLIQCKAATLAHCDKEEGKNVLVIVPSHLVVKYQTFFKKHRCENKIQLIAVTKFNDYHDLLHPSSVKQHVFVDELLYPLTVDEPQHATILEEQYKSFLERLLELLKSSDDYYVWAAVHGYRLTESLLSEKFRFAECISLRNITHIREISHGCICIDQMQSFTHKHVTPTDHLSKQFKESFEEFCISLQITMRTTKAIHDYKRQLEYEHFCYYQCERKEDMNSILKDKHFQLLFNSCLGHSRYGSFATIIEHPKDCSQYDINDRRNFDHFCAQVIATEISKLKQKFSKVPIKNQDIAIIADFYYYNKECDPLKKIKKHLQSKFRYKPKDFNGKNAITICYSNQIASLEWPVVFNVQYDSLKAPQRDSLFLEADQCLIISRCMTDYFLLCKSTNVNPPVSNRSFQSFYKWYDKQQNRKKTPYDAFKQYQEDRLSTI